MITLQPSLGLGISTIIPFKSLVVVAQLSFPPLMLIVLSILSTLEDTEKAVQITKSLYNIKNSLVHPNTIHRCLKKDGIKTVIEKKHPLLLVKYYKKYLGIVYVYKIWIKTR